VIREAELRELAEEHFHAGLGRKRRNALLRELGYDPAGEAGELYRAAYRAVVEANCAAHPSPGIQSGRVRVRCCTADQS
jgi:hypothetical protein